MSIYYEVLDVTTSIIKNHSMISKYVCFIMELFSVYTFSISFREKPPEKASPEDAYPENTPDSPPEQLVKEFPGIYKFIFLLINIIFSKLNFYIHKKYHNKKKQNKYIKGLYFVVLYVIHPILFGLSHLYFYTLFYPKNPLFHPKLYKNLKV